MLDCWWFIENHLSLKVVLLYLCSSKFRFYTGLLIKFALLSVILGLRIVRFYFLPSLLPFRSIQKVSRRKWTTRIYKIGDPRILYCAQIAVRVSPERTHRVGVFGFWALLICFFASSMELFLGILFWFISRNWSMVKVYQRLVHWFVIRTH